MTDTTIEWPKLLAHADLLMLNARLVSRPSCDEPSVCSVSERAMRTLADTCGSPDLADPLRVTMRAAGHTASEALRIEHTRLFEGPILCPITETAYIRRDKGVILADICGFHTAFGFETCTSTGEQPDHLAAELEFTAVLLLKSVVAVENEQHREADVCLQAARSFLEDHVAPWIELFCERLATTAQLELLVSTADLIRASLAAVCMALDVDVKSCVEPPAPAIDLNETPYECGMAEDEAQQTVTLTGPPGSGLPVYNAPSEGC